MIKISNICLHQNSIFIKVLKILKIHEIFCENPRIIFLLFYDVHKENMFTINLEDGHEAPYKASNQKCNTVPNLHASNFPSNFFLVWTCFLFLLLTIVPLVHVQYELLFFAQCYAHMFVCIFCSLLNKPVGCTFMCWSLFHVLRITYLVLWFLFLIDSFFIFFPSL